jgi:hypothetical protein
MVSPTLAISEVGLKLKPSYEDLVSDSVFNRALICTLRVPRLTTPTVTLCVTAGADDVCGAGEGAEWTDLTRANRPRRKTAFIIGI